MASSKKKQVAQDLEAADAELTSVSQELHSKQVAAGTMDQKMADSELELDSLKQSVHALHAEQVAAKHAQAQAQSQLDQTQAQLDGALLKLSSQEGLQHQGVSKFEDYSLMAKACMATQTDVHSQEEQVGVAVAGHGREEQGAAISKSFASEHDQECTPQASSQLRLECGSHFLLCYVVCILLVCNIFFRRLRKSRKRCAMLVADLNKVSKCSGCIHTTPADCCASAIMKVACPLHVCIFVPTTSIYIMGYIYWVASC